MTKMIISPYGATECNDAWELPSFTILNRWSNKQVEPTREMCENIADTHNARFIQISVWERTVLNLMLAGY